MDPGLPNSPKQLSQFLNSLCLCLSSFFLNSPLCARDLKHDPTQEEREILGDLLGHTKYQMYPFWELCGPPRPAPGYTPSLSNPVLFSQAFYKCLKLWSIHVLININSSSDSLHVLRRRMVLGKMVVAINEREIVMETFSFFSGRAIIMLYINMTPSFSCNKVRESAGTINWEFRRWFYWPRLLNRIGITVSRMETSAITFLK